MDISEVFDGAPLLQGLTPAERDRVSTHARLAAFSRGERIWEEGDQADEFKFAADGLVKLNKVRTDGRESIIELRQPFDLLCTSAVWGCSRYCCTAIAMKNQTQVLTLPRRDLLEFIQCNPRATTAFLKETNCRIYNLSLRVDELTSGGVEQRIATLLLRLAGQKRPQRGEEGASVPVALTRQDLADLCNTTVTTAIRVMTRFSEDGVVQRTPKGFSIENYSALENISHGGGKDAASPPPPPTPTLLDRKGDGRGGRPIP